MAVSGHAGEFTHHGGFIHNPKGRHGIISSFYRREDSFMHNVTYIHSCCPTRAIFQIPSFDVSPDSGASSRCQTVGGVGGGVGGIIWYPIHMQGGREGRKEGSAESKREERDEICISFGRSESGGARFPVQDLSLGRYCERGTCGAQREEERYCMRTRPRFSPKERIYAWLATLRG